MNRVKISRELHDLTKEITDNMEYYLDEHLGYLKAQNCRRIKDSMYISSENTTVIELSDEIMNEVMSFFNPATEPAQAVNLVLLCAYMFGGV